MKNPVSQEKEGTMFGKNHRRILIAALVIVLGLAATNAAAGPPPPIDPDGPVGDCGVWAYNPGKSGSLVIGEGHVSCVYNHNQLKVVVQIRDSTGRTGTAATKYCYSTNFCSKVASISYIGGRSYQTTVSGYVGSWQGYYQSDWVYIP